MAVVDVGTHAPASAEPFEHLVLDFLAYLEFERGLSRNTLEAYRSDLLQYGAYLDALTSRRPTSRASCPRWPRATASRRSPATLQRKVACLRSSTATCAGR